MSPLEVCDTVTMSVVSRSAKLSAPLSVSVGVPSPSIKEPTSSAMVSVGWSLVPVMVIVTVCGAEVALPLRCRRSPPRRSENVMVSPAPRKSRFGAGAVVPAVLVDAEAGDQRGRQRRRPSVPPLQAMSPLELWQTVTTSVVSRSAKLSAPLSVSVGVPSPSVNAPTSSRNGQRRLVVGAGDGDRHRVRRRGGVARSAVVGRHHVEGEA